MPGPAVFQVGRHLWPTGTRGPAGQRLTDGPGGSKDPLSGLQGEALLPDQCPWLPHSLLGQDPRCAAEPRGVLTGRNESLAPRDEEHFLGPPPNLQCCWGLPLNLGEQEPAWAGVCHKRGPKRLSLGGRVSTWAAPLLLLPSALRGLQHIQGSQLPLAGSREGEPGHAPPLPGYSLSAGCNLPDRQLGSFISASINF